MCQYLLLVLVGRSFGSTTWVHSGLCRAILPLQCGNNVAVDTLSATFCLLSAAGNYIISDIVYVCVCHLPVLPAFHRAELHMPTSLLNVRMADMQWSVEEERKKKVLFMFYPIWMMKAQQQRVNLEDVLCPVVFCWCCSKKNTAYTICSSTSVYYTLYLIILLWLTTKVVCINPLLWGCVGPNAQSSHEKLNHGNKCSLDQLFSAATICF